MNFGKKKINKKKVVLFKHTILNSFFNTSFLVKITAYLYRIYDSSVNKEAPTVTVSFVLVK